MLYFCPWIYVFVLLTYGAMQTWPQIMEQCRLCPAKSWSLRSLPHGITKLSFFAPQNYGAMQTLPAKSRRHSFKSQNNNIIFKQDMFLLLLIIFVNQFYCRDLYKHCDQYLRKTFWYCKWLPQIHLIGCWGVF